MAKNIGRREFLKLGAASCAMCLGGLGALASEGAFAPPALISPGCRKTKVKVARIFMGRPGAHWPNPNLKLPLEVQRYQREFTRMREEFRDIDFVVDRLATNPSHIRELSGQLAAVDGILAIHLSMGIRGMLGELLKVGRPTVLFAAPYSGHEWTSFGALRQQEAGAKLECILTSDLSQLAAAVRPFRALHHLREAKILNVTSRRLSRSYLDGIKQKFGTEVVQVGRERVLAAYNAVPDDAAREEARRWIAGAEAVVEPSEEEIFRSCKLALAFQRLLDEEQATVITVDCYGTMYHRLPAFPCIGFVRLNDMGLAGICESDLQSALTFIIYQGLVGRPGFISDPTMDGENIILAHCLGTRKMDGPNGPAAPYKLRTIMERQEGAVPQVRMRVGQVVTQAKLLGLDTMVYFTGEIVDTPETERGCRTKITVKVHGDAEKLWQNWTGGLHRVTCYGDLVADLKRFCRFAGINLVHEA